MQKVRVDKLLVDLGIAEDTDKALRLIMAGEVSSEGRRLESAGEKISPDAHIHIKSQKTYVSRGGHKLEGALKAFEISPKGLNCLDIGCSSGGFTDCLLKAGANHVSSVDVGFAQFDWALRQDSRVSLFEKTNIVDVDPHEIAAPFDLIVCDVSFTAIHNILDSVESLLTDTGVFLSLVKPQFEAPKELVGEGGVIRERSVHSLVLNQVLADFEHSSLNVKGFCVSTIKGPKGNREFFVCASKAFSKHLVDIEKMVDEAWKL